MDITLSLSDNAIKGLQYVADRRGQPNVTDLCMAVLIALAGEGLRDVGVQSDATIVAKVKAAPQALRDQIDAVKLTAEATPVDEVVPK